MEALKPMKNAARVVSVKTSCAHESLLRPRMINGVRRGDNMNVNAKLATRGSQDVETKSRLLRRGHVRCHPCPWMPPRLT